jgi:hypothetical protein
VAAPASNETGHDESRFPPFLPTRDRAEEPLSSTCGTAEDGESWCMAFVGVFDGGVGPDDGATLRSQQTALQSLCQRDDVHALAPYLGRYARRFLHDAHGRQRMVPNWLGNPELVNLQAPLPRHFHTFRYGHLRTQSVRFAKRRCLRERRSHFANCDFRQI